MKRNTILLLALILGALSLMGQLTRGFVSGTILDPSGAVVVGAKVTLVNIETGIRAEMAANTEGFYRFVAVEPGVYALEVSANGFEVSKVANFRVGSAQEVTIHQTLKVGSSTTMVEVLAEAAGVELAKTTATIDRKLEQRVIEFMPLTAAMRDVNVLALTAPTVSRGPGSTGISANGQRARNNNFMLDGVDNNDPSVTIANSRVIPEALGEYQIQTAAYSAEFGRNSGAQIMATTRSGTNSLKGEIWNYYAGDWMEPLNLLNKRAGITDTPRYSRNQAGGSLAGPVIRNKTFFFGLVETNRFRQASDARNASVINIPTPTGFAALGAVPLGPDQTPQSRQDMMNAIGFLREIHPQVPRFTNIRNVAVNGIPIEVGAAQIPFAQPANFWYWTGRADHRLSDRDNIGYRIQIDQRDQPNVTSNVGFATRFAASQTILGQNHAWNWTRTFTPTLINELRFSYVRRVLDFPENDPVTPTTSILGFFTIGGLSNFPQGRTQNSFQWQNVTTKLMGKHSLKFGADIRHTMLFNNAAFDSKGTWTFQTFPDFMNNRAFSLAQAVNMATFDARQQNYFLFFQDDWRVTRTLTLNLGMRYEYNTVPFGFFGAANDAVAAVGVPRDVVVDRNNWAPRGGFAWSPEAKGGFLGKLLGEGKTVFRGGYGMGYDVLFFNILTVNANNFPRVVVNNTNFPDTLNLYPRLAPLTAVPVLNPLGTFVNSPTQTQNPTTHFYSFSIQRQLSGNYILELGYSGNRSYHGIRQGQANPGMLTPAQAATVVAGGTIPSLQARRLNPLWGPRVMIESTAMASYNAVYARLDKKFARGLQFGFNYTFSRNMSDNDESLGVADIVGSSPQVPQDFFNYRNEWSRSVFDRTHRAVAYYTYEVPWFQGGFLGNSVLRNVLGGWQATGLIEAQSGMPFTVRTGVDSGGTGTTAPHRPNWNPGGILTMDPVMGNFRTFTTPLDGTGVFHTLVRGGLPVPNSLAFGGNLGRNAFRGPGFFNTNFSLLKRVNLTERFKAELRWDMINAMNRRNFLNPIVLMNSPIFGTNVADPGNRTMLLSAKIRF
jgi:hypothetical protein